MKRIDYVIAEPEGLHALPAAALVVKLQEYKSEITATCKGVTVDAKNPIGLLSLGARFGDLVVFEANGPDENLVEL